MDGGQFLLTPSLSLPVPVSCPSPAPTCVPPTPTRLFWSSQPPRKQQHAACSPSTQSLAQSSLGLPLAHSSRRRPIPRPRNPPPFRPQYRSLSITIHAQSPPGGCRRRQTLAIDRGRAFAETERLGAHAKSPDDDTRLSTQTKTRIAPSWPGDSAPVADSHPPSSSSLTAHPDGDETHIHTLRRRPNRQLGAVAPLLRLTLCPATTSPQGTTPSPPRLRLFD